MENLSHKYQPRCSLCRAFLPFKRPGSRWVVGASLYSNLKWEEVHCRACGGTHKEGFAVRDPKTGRLMTPDEAESLKPQPLPF